MLEVDVAGEQGSSQKRFTGVQIDIDISRPLMPGVFLPRANLPELSIRLKFEKLADVCYGFDIIGHELQICKDDIFKLRNPFDYEFRGSGPWLRAENNNNFVGVCVFQTLKLCLCPMLARDELSYRFINHCTS